MFESSFNQNENKDQDEKAEKIINNNIVEVVDRAEMRALISLHRAAKFTDIIEKSSDTPFDERIITSVDITTRDIIEFSLHTRIAGLLQEAEEILLERNYIDINDLQNKLYALLDNYQTSHKNSSLLPSQREFLQNSIKKITNGISETDNFLSTSTNEKIISKIGPIFSEIDPKYLNIDKTSYPGAVAVYIKDFPLYNKILGNSVGVYSQSFGVNQLEKRFFIINDEYVMVYEPTNYEDHKIEIHEYFHFLYHQLEPEANFLTGKMEKESKKKENEITEYYKTKLDTLQNEINDELTMIENNVKDVTEYFKLKTLISTIDLQIKLKKKYANTNEELSNSNPEIQQLESKIAKLIKEQEENAIDINLADLHYELRNIKFSEVSLTEKQMPRDIVYSYSDIYTYKDNINKSAFSTFKDEFFAYYTTGSPPNNFWVLIGGDEKKSALEATVYGRALLSELNGLKKLVDVALQRGHTPEELAYLIIGTRSVSQAQKFIYLHMQRAGTAHSSLNSQVSDINNSSV